MDHTAWLTLITGVLGALTLAAVKIWGEPGKRMAHQEALEALEAKAEAARAKSEAKRSEANERLMASWERRAETLETRQALLDAANQSLRARIDELERLVKTAGNVHTADLATIANLREELDAHVAELATTREALSERDARIAALESRVAELEASLRDCPVGAGCKAKKPAAKKKGGRA